MAVTINDFTWVNGVTQRNSENFNKMMQNDRNLKNAVDELQLNTMLNSTTNTVTIAELCSRVPDNETRIFKYVFVSIDDAPSDYPTALIRNNAVYFPIVTITKLSSAVAYIHITAPNIYNGHPYTIDGYYNGKFYWSTNNDAAAFNNWQPITINKNMQFSDGIVNCTEHAGKVSDICASISFIMSNSVCSGFCSVVNNIIQIRGYNGGSPMNATMWVCLTGMVKLS